jgi:polar amino acid transport system permease protein
LTSLAALFGLLFALVLASARRSSIALISWPAATFVEIVRNTPLIVQLFFVVFGLPMLFGYRWPLAMSALLALALNFSAYYSEIIRAGLDNLGQGQHEAAYSLSLSKIQSFFLIVLPQAINNIYPSLVSQFVFLFLTTGIISEIGVEELTWSGRFIADRTFRDFEVYLVLTICYVAMALLFKLFFAALGRKLFPWQHPASDS